MRKPTNRTVKTLVTTTAFAGVVLAAPAVSYADFGDQPLKQGMKDPDVRQLQDLLKEKGYFHFPRSTGYFGSITKEAVIHFQQDHSLKATGVVKGRTFKELGAESLQQVLGSRALRRGSQGEAVSELQTKLKRFGFYKGKIDGMYGPLTTAAVRKFQRARGLAVDGIAGPVTLGALYGQPSRGGGGSSESAGESTGSSKGSSEGFTFTKQLTRGSRGEAVSKLQRRLKEAGLYTYTVDGMYGPRTASAVRQYQRAHGLKVDGIAGPVTLGSLFGEPSQSGGSDDESAEEKPAGSTKETEASESSAKDSGGSAKEAEVPPEQAKEAKASENGIPITEQLMRGSRGEAVSTLQRRLKEAGLYTYTVDGMYGPRTASAVRQYQRAHGLKVDGIAGPVTLGSLFGDDEGAEAGGKQAEEQKEDDGQLSFRDSGGEVTALQKKLNKIGVLDKSPSGYYGMDTEEAVRAFQAKYGLKVDGIVGPVTRAKLTEVLAEKEQAEAPKEDDASSFSAINLIADAADLIGVPYQWGGELPTTGFDCSGFVQYIFAENGIDLPRTVAWMWNTDFGRTVDNLQPGDVVFFEDTYKNGPSHNGVYIGNGKFIQSGSSSGVTISNLDYRYWSSHYLGAKRFF